MMQSEKYGDFEIADYDDLCDAVVECLSPKEEDIAFNQILVKAIEQAGHRETLQWRVGEWGRVTFAQATNQSISKHLREEAEEVLLASVCIDEGLAEQCTYCQESGLPEECADVLLLLLHLAHRNDFDLFQAAEEKFQRIRDARWQDDGRGYMKRVKEETSCPN